MVEEKKKRKQFFNDTLDKITRPLITVYANNDEGDRTKMSCSTIKEGTSDTLLRLYNKVLHQATNDSALNSLCNVPVIR